MTLCISMVIFIHGVLGESASFWFWFWFLWLISLCSIKRWRCFEGNGSASGGVCAVPSGVDSGLSGVLSVLSEGSSPLGIAASALVGASSVVDCTGSTGSVMEFCSLFSLGSAVGAARPPLYGLWGLRGGISSTGVCQLSLRAQKVFLTRRATRGGRLSRGRRGSSIVVLNMCKLCGMCQ